jgi:hypothetical protein
MRIERHMILNGNVRILNAVLVPRATLWEEGSRS